MLFLNFTHLNTVLLILNLPKTIYLFPYLDFITFSVRLQGYKNSIEFDLTEAFHEISSILLLPKFINFGIYGP
jgi:hypothetical protein